MAKEMMIIFLYDTQLLQREEDDPSSAILYFYPGWVSNQQRTSLCGQIIGTTSFLQTVFHPPRIFALHSGKFSIRTYGRYILAAGTDRNIADWVLENRIDTLVSFISFYHHDMGHISELYPETSSLSAKLYHMFETYLKILAYGSHMFLNIPSIQLPKSANHVFMEAMQLLQCCQELNYVLGGAVLYHNKVVATQLSSDLTKCLVLTDPYRIKSPAEPAEVQYSLPLGVQLLKVHITRKDYSMLLLESQRCKKFNDHIQKRNAKKEKPPNRESIVSAMKRDQSLIFTMVPEEDSDQHSPSIKPLPVAAIRPKSLNLKLKSLSQSIDEDKKPVGNSLFSGQTSVCSTPMTELKKFVHYTALSICMDPEDVTKAVQENFSNSSKNFGKEAVYSKELTKSRSSCEISNAKLYAKYKTIVDPLFPVFKPNGRPISYSLYQQYLKEKPARMLPLENKFKDFDITKVKKEPDKAALPNRKSLTLPLKSLTSDGTDSIFSPQCYRRGVQLTPLMAKLSLLAAEERSSGFCSRATTPSENRISLPRSKRKPSTGDDPESNELREVVLFVCGQQDMVMGVLLEYQIELMADTVNKLFEKCTESLSPLERQLRHCLDMCPAGGSDQSSYSYLYMDPHSDSVQRGGPWSGVDLGVVTHLHRDFINTHNLTEIILRNDESVIYGHQCAKTKVFYQQSVSSTAGLPTPADAMGVVPIKAKRCLERDHSIILL